MHNWEFKEFISPILCEIPAANTNHGGPNHHDAFLKERVLFLHISFDAHQSLLNIKEHLFFGVFELADIDK